MTSEQQCFDQYVIKTQADGTPEVLSSDGTGTTYRARNRETEKPVLVRVFGDQLLSNSAIQKDFVERARLLIELDHPNITRIVDTGQYGAQFYYVLEDPGGDTLTNLVKKQPLPPALAMKLASQINDALLAVRSQPGLLSRVWPSSIMVNLENEYQPKLMLIAQSLLNSTPPVEMPELLAPEVLKDEIESVSSSIYSIGATLYYMLTGQPPHKPETTVEKLVQSKQSNNPDFSLLPPGSPANLLHQLLDRDPKARPKSILEWDKALQRYIRFNPNEVPVAASPAPAPITSRAEGTQQPELVTELARAQAHTQRLSLELTRRVQKELALTEQLKALEAELAKEKQEAIRKPPIPEAQNNEWKLLEEAKQEIEKQRKILLEKTQSISLKELELEKQRTDLLKATQRIVAKPLPESQPVPSQPAAHTEPAQSTASAQEGSKRGPGVFRRWLRNERLTEMPTDNKVAAATTSDTTAPPPTDEPAALPPKSDPVLARPPGLVSPIQELEPQAKPQVPFGNPFPQPRAEATPKIEVPKIELPRADAPKVEAPKIEILKVEAPKIEVPKEAPRIEAPKFEVPKPLAEPILPNNRTPFAQSLAEPSREKAELGVPFQPPRSVAEPITESQPKLRPQEEPTPAISPPEPSALREKEELFDVLPVRAAWVALALLALILALMMAKVYQTFFRDPMPRTEDSPVVFDPRLSSPAQLSRESKVNSELKLEINKIELEKHENRRLVQDQDWKGLLQRMRLLDHNWQSADPDALRNIEAEVLREIRALSEATAKNQGNEYEELRNYLLARVEKR